MSHSFSHSYRRSAITLVSAAAAASLMLASCAPDDDDDGATEPNGTETVTVTAEPTEDSSDTATDAESTDQADATEATDSPEATDGSDASQDHPVFTALDAVQAEYPDATIIDFDYEGGSVDVHIIEGDTEWELTVDPDTEDITSTEEERADRDDLAEIEAASVDITEALRTAVQESGAEPAEGSIDSDFGTVLWEFEMSDGTEVHVDAATGDIRS